MGFQDISVSETHTVNTHNFLQNCILSQIVYSFILKV